MKTCAILILVAFAFGQEIAYDNIVPEGTHDAVTAWDELPDAKEVTLPNETYDPAEKAGPEDEDSSSLLATTNDVKEAKSKLHKANKGIEKTSKKNKKELSHKKKECAHKKKHAKKKAKKKAKKVAKQAKKKAKKAKKKATKAKKKAKKKPSK